MPPFRPCKSQVPSCPGGRLAARTAQRSAPQVERRPIHGRFRAVHFLLALACHQLALFLALRQSPGHSPSQWRSKMLPVVRPPQLSALTSWGFHPFQSRGRSCPAGSLVVVSAARLAAPVGTRLIRGRCLAVHFLLAL